MTAHRLLVPFYALALISAQISSSGAEEIPNMLTNGDFEKGLRGWEIDSWKDTGTHKIDKKETYRGNPTLRLDSKDPDHTMATQVIAVEPNTRYRITAMVKAENIQFHEKGKDGPCLGIRGTFEKTKPLPKAFDWQEVVFDFDSKDRTEIEVGPHLGWHASVVSGTAWFSNLRMVKL